MILTKEVEVTPSGQSIQYYKDKGYDAKWHEPLVVKIEDLPSRSSSKIDAICDYCGKTVYSIRYADYCLATEIFGAYACKKCNQHHIKKSCLERYGKECTLQVPEIREKGKMTCIEKYGADNPLKNEKIKKEVKQTLIERYGEDYAHKFREKSTQTCLEKYGVDHPSKTPEWQEKKRLHNLKVYGTNHPMQNYEFYQKFRENLLHKYGVVNMSQLPEIKEKVANSFYQNGTQKTSQQQRYLNSLFGGELNYPIKYYDADICFPDEHFIIEYDGGGHDLNVRFKRITEDEFKRKEIIRHYVVKREGFKTMRIISCRDYLPEDEVLLSMLENARQYFSDYPNHSWIEFNIDTSTVRNAEQKDGVFFNFGKLRKITKKCVA